MNIKIDSVEELLKAIGIVHGAEAERCWRRVVAIVREQEAMVERIQSDQLTSDQTYKTITGEEIVTWPASAQILGSEMVARLRRQFPSPDLQGAQRAEVHQPVWDTVVSVTGEPAARGSGNCGAVEFVEACDPDLPKRGSLSRDIKRCDNAWCPYCGTGVIDDRTPRRALVPEGAPRQLICWCCSVMVGPASTLCVFCHAPLIPAPPDEAPPAVPELGADADALSLAERHRRVLRAIESGTIPDPACIICWRLGTTTCEGCGNPTCAEHRVATSDHMHPGPPGSMATPEDRARVLEEWKPSEATLAARDLTKRVLTWAADSGQDDPEGRLVARARLWLAGSVKDPPALPGSYQLYAKGPLDRVVVTGSTGGSDEDEQRATLRSIKRRYLETPGASEREARQSFSRELELLDRLLGESQVDRSASMEPITDAHAFDWTRAKDAAAKIVKLCEDAWFSPPEALDLHQHRASRVCAEIDEIAAALRLQGNVGKP